MYYTYHCMMSFADAPSFRDAFFCDEYYTQMFGDYRFCIAWFLAHFRPNETTSRTNNIVLKWSHVTISIRAK